jgi:hypothetical protein
MRRVRSASVSLPSLPSFPSRKFGAEEDDADGAFAFELSDFFWFEEREPEDEDWAGADDWWLDDSDF